MFPGVEALINSPASAVGVLAVMLIALMTGVVVPGKTAQKRVDDANRRAGDYEHLYRKSEAAGELLRSQVMELAGVQRVRQTGAIPSTPGNEP